MPRRRSPATTGITVRHQRKCRSVGTALACNCKPSYRAEVHDPSTKRPLKSPTFKSLPEARAWRITTQNALRNAPRALACSITVEEAAAQWLAEIRTGAALNRSGQSYKPSVVRSYETSLRLHVLPVLGKMKLGSVQRRDVQELIDKIRLTRNARTVRNAINPLRALYRRAGERGLVDRNPTDGLSLPAGRGRRERIASPAEAEALIAALPADDHAIWATAFYGGLRLGELQALTVDCIDLARGWIEVSRSWDPKEGLVEPKSHAGNRRVPIPAALREHLTRHLETRTVASRFVFGISGDQPFKSEGARRRAYAAWDACGLKRIKFHEARHTYASISIGAGVDAKRLSTFMGHSSIATTYDIYGHLFPGSEAESAALIDNFLAGEQTAVATPTSTPTLLANAH